MKKHLIYASKTSYIIGLILFSIHLLISWWIIIDLGTSELNAQWILIWLYFFPFDLPFSFLFLMGIFLPNWSFSFLPYPVSQFRAYLVPSFVFGVIGPIWYFFIPVIISNAWGKHKLKRENKI
jgi:hypothetical protein